MDGIIIVTSPQELVSMIVTKAVNMAKMMDVPILGLVENMSYFQCPGCGEKYKIFGDSHLEDVANANGLKILGRLPGGSQAGRRLRQGRHRAVRRRLAGSGRR